MTTKPTPEQLDRLRAASVDPQTWNEDEYSVEVVFSTGADVRKYDWRTGQVYIERLPLAGMDLSELNNGAHVLRSHGLEEGGLEDVIGSVKPGTARIVEGEASATVILSRAECDKDVVDKIRQGVIRKLSYGYEKLGEPAVTKDAAGVETRTWAAHRPYEISFVAVPADGGTNTRAAEGAGANETRRESMSTEHAPAGTTGTETAPVNLDEIRAAAEKAAHDRQLGIRAAAKKLGVPEAEAEKLCADRTVSLDDARAKLIDLAAKADEATKISSTHTTIESDPDLMRLKGLEEALLHRTSPDHFKLTDNARRFRSMRMADVARAFAGPRGAELSDAEAIGLVLNPQHTQHAQRALLATSDFPSLLANVAQKNFDAGQSTVKRWFEGVCGYRPRRDFRDGKEVKMVMPAVIPTLAENAEYTYRTVTDDGETWHLLSKADIIGLTRQALINDDTQAFGTIPREQGFRIIRTENAVMAAILNANAAMADGKALFHADHNNLTASGGAAPDVAEIGKGRKLLRQAKDSSDGGVLGLVPKFLLVPADLETVAEQLLTAITPATSATSMPEKIRALNLVVIDDLTSAKMWYLSCDPMFRPALVYGRLEGQENARLSVRPSLTMQGVEFLVEHDFGGAAANYVSIYRNKGEA